MPREGHKQTPDHKKAKTEGAARNREARKSVPRTQEPKKGAGGKQQK